jgi:hypothetical protein
MQPPMIVMVRMIAVMVLTVPVGAGEVIDIAQVRVFTVNEQVIDKDSLDLALGIPSQLWVRPWFRWHQARDYQKDAWVIAPCHERGISFGGGLTLSALYQGENGLDERTIREFLTCDPWGKPYPAFGNAANGYWHGSLANHRYLDYALSWGKKQIDAGVDNLFLDEVDGAYSIHEGFDDQGLAGFRSWLTRRYCQGEQWSLSDARWTTHFQIDLADTAICPDGGIATFNYRVYLQKHGWADQPDRAENPLRDEWGSPGDLRIGKSYCCECREQALLYQVDALRTYARSVGRRVLLAANGLNRHVDFQIQGLWEDYLPRIGGHLDATKSYATRWRTALARSRQLLGHEVPVMFFHDWGDGFPYWQHLDGEGHRTWMRLYAPEIYAAGGFFAFPVMGPFGCDARTDGSLATIKTLAAFFDHYAELYRNTIWMADRTVVFDRPGPTCIAKGQTDRHRLLLHIFNHACLPDTGRLATLTDVILRCPRLGTIRSAVLVSPDAPESQPLTTRIEQGQVVITIPTLSAYALVVIDHDDFDPRPMAADVAIPLAAVWARPLQQTFAIAAEGLGAESELPNAFIQGRLHPQLRDNPEFLVDFPGPGSFIVSIEAVADQGARLEVLVDGYPATTVEFAGAGAPPPTTPIAIPISAGKHRIAIDNHGPDWLRLGAITLSGYGR